ncbi:MAG: hypothetical protein P1P87_05980 [Trueperaceae bacterium]|nr:hypothetical protein [Trueperaceae bacterium]
MDRTARRPRARRLARAPLAAAAALAALPLLAGCLARGDAMPPTVSIREPRSGATSTTADLRIVGYAFDDEDVAAIRIDGLDLMSTPTYAPERGKGLVEFSFTIRDLTDGDVTVLIEAQDLGGRVTTFPYRLRLDSTPPVLELGAVTALDGGRVRVEGVARDNFTLTSIRVNGVPLAFTPGPEHAFRVDVASVAGGEVVVEDAAGNVTRRALP